MKSHYCIAGAITPIIPPDCLSEWLVKVDEIPSPSNMTKDHAYQTPDDKVYVLSDDGKSVVPFGSGGSSSPTTLSNTDGFLNTTGSTDYNQVLNFNQQKLKDIIGEAVDEIITPKHITEGLAHHFDFKDNEATGNYNPAAAGWVDLITGTVTTLQNTTWGDGLEFRSTSSKCFYSGVDVVRYTITNTHKVRALAGSHPRIFGENPYPTLYMHSGADFGYKYGFFAQGKDAVIPPGHTPPVNTLVQATLRFTGTIAQGGTGTVELFFNGVKVGELTGVTQNPASVATKYLGSRSANDRTLQGSFFEHLVYTRALTDDEIYNNYLASKHRYPQLGGE